MSPEIVRSEVQEGVVDGVRALAIYLPQFHPVRENDQWWGTGFTEWTNVAKAVPLYRGHYQPHIPADLGFYDLRLAEAREAQASLAFKYGVDGFCYYHYWFEGRRLLERPFEEVLESRSPSQAFCLCWANETWSRRWLGEERDILLAQTYSTGDHVTHGDWLCRAFADPRYVRVRGRPLFLIYRPLDIPEPERAMDIIRTRSIAAGLSEPFIAGVDSRSPGRDLRKYGFDATVNFAPQLSALRGAFLDGRHLKRLAYNILHNRLVSSDLKVYRYSDLLDATELGRPSFAHFPMVTVSWDNSARRGRNGIIVQTPTPAEFELAVRNGVRATASSPRDERILFVNAWNEWAEGNHLEPDLRHGHAFLTALRAGLAQGPATPTMDRSP